MAGTGIRTISDMDLGAELVLLAVDETHSRIRNGNFVALTLAATEIIALARTGNVELRGGQLFVSGEHGVTDPDLVVALELLASSKRRVTVAAWLVMRGSVARVRARLLELVDADVVEVDDVSKSMAGADAMSVRIIDGGAVRAAVERLAGAARGTLTGADDEALAVLADAAGLAHAHLRGLSNRRARARLRTLTGKRVPTPPEPDRTVLAIARAAALAVAEIAARSSRGTGGGSMAIPIDQQFGTQIAMRTGWADL